VNRSIINKAKLQRFFWQTVLLNVSATLFVIGFDVFTLGWANAFSLRRIWGTFIYSNCIGSLISLVIVVFIQRHSNASRLFQSVKIIPLIILMTYIGQTIGSFILSPLRSEGFVLLPNVKGFGFSLIISFVYASSLYFYESSRAKLEETQGRLRQKEIDEFRARILVTEAQLASLEARVHPHFLFNTLNSIASLIRDEPILAEIMVEKLSALLRYSLESNEQSLVRFDRELKITQNYLEIEKTRFGSRLNYKIDFDKLFDHVMLPPFSLQSLVENSIKHVAAKHSSKTEIFLSGKRADGFFEIIVSDNGEGFDESKIREGHGIDNLIKRLQKLFGGKASLQIDKKGIGSTVRLRIPSERSVND
jgi:LytS/YehU family sensor histidine kinase